VKGGGGKIGKRKNATRGRTGKKERDQRRPIKNPYFMETKNQEDCGKNDPMESGLKKKG